MTLKYLVMRWSGLLCTVAMAGCTTFTTGTRVTPENMPSLRVGTTSSAEVLRALGSPSDKKITGDRTVYSYVHSQMEYDAVSAIPIVNAFVTRATTSRSELALEFDRSGILSKCTFINGNSRIEGAAVASLVGKMPDQKVTSETRECGADPARVTARPIGEANPEQTPIARDATETKPLTPKPGLMSQYIEIDAASTMCTPNGRALLVSENGPGQQTYRLECVGGYSREYVCSNNYCKIAQR